MNQMQISRRSWVIGATTGIVAASLGAGGGPASEPTLAPAPAPGKKKDKGPPIATNLVKEFVGAGHANLPRVREMLAAYPTIINGTWDWGGGDFETALGGASHMGRPDIANVLLEHGARMDLFAAAMLGKLEIVRAACTAFPNAPSVPGPHGITLMDHAIKGGDAAVAVVEYLRSLS